MRISELSLIKKEYKDLEIIVDSNYTSTDSTFISCTIKFTECGKLTLQNCYISTCTFVGIDKLSNYNKGYGELSILKSTSFIHNTLTNKYAVILFFYTKLNHFADNSISTHYKFENSEVTDFLIEGETKKVTLNTTVFDSSSIPNSLWNKKVSIDFVCQKVTFLNIKLNPYFLATKCDDKSSIDLSQAIIVNDWEKLRKKYSGLSLFIVFLLTAIFFIPLFTNSFFLLLISKLKPNNLTIKEAPLWDVILFDGKQGIKGWFHCILTFTLLFYNIARIYITVIVARLREGEHFLENNGFKKFAMHRDKYEKILPIDKALAIIFWISLSYSLFKLFISLRIIVPYLN